jgi:hypothetical protein
MGPERRGEQRRHFGEGGESSLGTLDFALLVEVGGRQPGMKVQRVAGRIEDHAAIDDAQSVVHAQPKALEHRGQVPWINRLAIHGCLTTHGVQPGAIQKSRQQRVTDNSLVHPGDSRGGAGKRVSYTRFGQQRGLRFDRLAEHAFLPRMSPPAQDRQTGIS